MKTFKVILLLTALISGLGACKKDKDQRKEPENATKQKVLGRWNFIAMVIETTKPPAPTETETHKGRAEHYFEFRADGIAKTNIEGEEETSYHIENNQIRLFGRHYTIKELTANKFVFEEQYTVNGQSSKTTFTLGR